MPNNPSNLTNEPILPFSRCTLQMSPSPVHLTCPICHRLFFSSLKFIDHFQIHYHEHQARVQALSPPPMPVPQMSPTLPFNRASHTNGNYITPPLHPSWARYFSHMSGGGGGGQSNPMAGSISGHSTRVQQGPWMATCNGFNGGNLNAGLPQTRPAERVAEQRERDGVPSDLTSPFLNQLDHPIPKVVILDNDDDGLDLSLKL